jgi:DNA-binding NtrC family response regulator
MPQRLVFVIDDHAGIRRLVEAELQEIGCRVDTFADAEEAAVAVQECGRPAVILVDPWAAPVEDPLHSNLLRLSEDDSLIVMAGMRNTALLAEERGLPFLWKPFDPAALIDLVRVALHEADDRVSDLAALSAQ